MHTSVSGRTGVDMNIMKCACACACAVCCVLVLEVDMRVPPAAGPPHSHS